MELSTLKKTNAGRSSPRQAMKRLLRMVRVLKLGPGDKLPPQTEIRKALGITNFVIDDAMEALKGYGALSRSRSAGTVLGSLEKLPLEIFDAAILSMSPALKETSPFALTAFTYLTLETLKSGLGCRPFVAKGAHSDGKPFRDSDFMGIEEAVENCGVDLILSPVRLYGDVEKGWESKGVPLVDMSHNNSRCGVICDTKAMSYDAALKLHEAGARRLGIVNMDRPKPDHDFFWTGFTQALGELGIPLSEGVLLTSDMEVVEGGRIVADKYLALPESARPDALIFQDDRIAISFERLLISKGLKLPKMAVKCNVQIPMEFHTPVMKYGLDVLRYAELAVEIGRKRLLRPELPLEARLLPISRID